MLQSCPQQCLPRPPSTTKLCVTANVLRGMTMIENELEQHFSLFVFEFLVSEAQWQVLPLSFGRL